MNRGRLNFYLMDACLLRRNQDASSSLAKTVRNLNQLPVYLMSITAARKSKALFTEPYAAIPAVFVAAPNGRLPDTKTQVITLPRLNTSEQIALVAIRKAFLNGTIGVQKGTTHENFLHEYIDGYAAIRTYENQRQLDKDVESGQVAAMLVGLGYAMPLVKR